MSTYKFKPGDYVITMFEHPSRYNGWNNSWVKSMTEHLGSLFVVVRWGLPPESGVGLRPVVSKEGVRVDTGRFGVCYYPPVCLLRVPKKRAIQIINRAVKQGVDYGK